MAWIITKDLDYKVRILGAPDDYDSDAEDGQWNEDNNGDENSAYGGWQGQSAGEGQTAGDEVANGDWEQGGSNSWSQQQTGGEGQEAKNKNENNNWSSGDGDGDNGGGGDNHEWGISDKGGQGGTDGKSWNPDGEASDGAPLSRATKNVAPKDSLLTPRQEVAPSSMADFPEEIETDHNTASGDEETTRAVLTLEFARTLFELEPLDRFPREHDSRDPDELVFNEDGQGDSPSALGATSSTIVDRNIIGEGLCNMMSKLTPIHGAH